MSRKLRFGVLAAAALLTGSTTAMAGGQPSPSAAEGATIAVVTHGQASDPFWSVFKRGVDDAAAAMGANVTYSAPATFDMVEMASLIDAAVATNPDGLVVSVPDFDALQPSLAAANEAGIPIITVNSGSDNYQEIGAITHIGQDETIAGAAAGQRLVDAGATNVICINQEVGNAGLDARCAGAAGAQSTISSTLQADDTIDAVLALGPTGAAPALAALDELGTTGDTLLGTFDLSPEVIQAIIDGTMLFAVDQQQYLQGYLPIVFLTLNRDNLNTVGGGQPVLTGPGFVDASNAEQVLELTGSGSR